MPARDFSLSFSTSPLIEQATTPLPSEISSALLPPEEPDAEPLPPEPLPPEPPSPEPPEEVAPPVIVPAETDPPAPPLCLLPSPAVPASPPTVAVGNNDLQINVAISFGVVWFTL